ncbi:MAG: hypothetical protein R3B09_06875 [Nannocystaceae bacterium]
MWKRRRNKTDPLLGAIRAGDLAEVSRMFELGADLNVELPKSSGRALTPLCQAAISNRLDVAMWLLERGATPESLHELAGLLLLEAVAARSLELVRLLLARGVSADQGGLSVMREAAFSGSKEIFEDLMKHGGNVRELEVVPEDMLLMIRGDILRLAMGAGAQLSDRVATSAAQYRAAGDTGVPPDTYRG